MNDRPAAFSALDDVRVLDLAGEEAVYCTKLLADLGANVIRVEPPGGSPIRRRPPFVGDRPGAEAGILHLYFNTSKRGITLNLETADGREIFRRLAAGADVVVESFPVGHLAGLGLAYDDLVKVKPDLVMTSVTGFGQTGPHAEWLTSDLVAVAMSGIMTLAGFPDLPPHRPYASQAFYCGGVEAAIGTLMAITSRDLSGEGEHVDVSLQESLSMAQETAMQGWDFQKSNRRRAGAGVRIGVSGLSECKDGHVFSLIGLSGAGAPVAEFVRWMAEDGMGGDLASNGVLAQLEEMARVPRGTPGLAERMTAMRDNIGRVSAVARGFFESKAKQELYVEGQAHGFLIGPVNTPKDLVESEQLQDRGWFVDLPHPELGTTIKMPGLPYRLMDSPASLRRRAPLLGEHNFEIYGNELGLTSAEMASMRSAGVI